MLTQNIKTMRTTGNDIEININGVTLCYDDIGEGSVPVIFIHGFPFDKSMWKPQLDFLQSSQRVIALDMRGFGKSTRGNFKASISLVADDLIQFMDALEIDSAVICGLSMGGYVALNALNRYPEKFNAIILSDTQCIADSAEAREKRFKTIQQIEANGLHEFAEGFVKNIFCKDSLATKTELLDRIKNIILSTEPQSITETLVALAERSETCSILNSISIPALILCGSEDVITPPAQSEFLKDNIKNSEWHRIDHAGHMTNLEQPDEFNKHVKKFISGFLNKPIAF